MTSEPLDRALGLAGALGGLVWAAIPAVAAVAFLGLELGRLGTGALASLGVLFTFGGLSVAGMFAGTLGLYRRYAAVADPWPTRGAVTLAVGQLLLVPGAVAPSGSLPPSVDAVVPLVFFAGLFAMAVGSLAVGVGASRGGLWPRWLGAAFGAAMPVGTAAGALVAFVGAGNLALVLGLMVPYGLAWLAVGGAMAADRI